MQCLSLEKQPKPQQKNQNYAKNKNYLKSECSCTTKSSESQFRILKNPKKTTNFRPDECKDRFSDT